MAFQAFISYSHSSDIRLASIVQSSLQRFAKPWYRMRSMRVFRDKTSLAANPDLIGSLETALRESVYLLLFASPESARSPWVQREVAWWIEHRSVDTVVIVLTGGELIWDDAPGDYDWSRTTALPASLRGRFSREPLFVDLRWAQGGAPPSQKDSRFRSAVLDIAAPLLGRPKDELDGEDVQQHARFKRAVWAAAVVGLVLASAAAFASWTASRSAREASSRNLAAHAEELRTEDPNEALELAIRAWNTAPTEEANNAIARAFVGPSKTLIGHVGPLTHATFSPDGRLVATVGADKTARVWDAIDGHAVYVLAGHQSTLEFAAFSPDNSRLVTTSRDRTARIWEIATGQLVATLTGHTRRVTTAAFSPDGRRIVTASWDDTPRVWDVGTGHLLAALQGHEETVYSVSFSPDGSRVVTAGKDGTVKVFNVENGALLRTLQAVADKSAFSLDGSRIITMSGDREQMWDAASGRLVATRADWAANLASIELRDSFDRWNADDTRRLGIFSDRDSAGAVTGGRGARAGIWQAQRLLATLEAHTSPVVSASFSPDKERIVTASVDGTARIWTVGAAGRLVFSVERVDDAALSPDGMLIVIVGDNGRGKSVKQVLDAVDGHVVTTLEDDGTKASHLAYSPAGRRVVAITFIQEHPFTRIWNIDNGRLVATIPGAWEDVSRDGLVLVDSDDAGTRIIDASSGNLIAKLSSTDQQNRDGSFSENGRTVVALGRDNVVRLWNTADGGQGRTFPVGPDPSSAVVLSPDGRRVVTLTGNRARIWSDDGQLLGVLDGHTADINVVSYSPDGKLIVTASDDKSARVWDATTGKAVAIMAEHAGPVYTARFLSDGSHVVTGADDQKVIIWSAWTGATVATLYGHRNGVTHIVSSLDGRHILTAGLDSVARKYEILTRADLARLLR